MLDPPLYIGPFVNEAKKKARVPQHKAAANAKALCSAPPQETESMDACGQEQVYNPDGRVKPYRQLGRHETMQLIPNDSDD